MKETNEGVSKLISKVVAYWSDEDYNRATETAEYATKKYPENADLWCLLGRAYLAGTELQAKKADAALRKAADLSCSRPELRSLRIKAKELIGDWTGIIQLFQERQPTDSSDIVILAKAYQSLGGDQASAGSWTNAEGYYRKGCLIIQDAFRAQKAHGNVEALKSLKVDLGVSFVDAISQRVQLDDEKIEIWDAFEITWKADVRHRDAALRGIAAATSWCDAVSRRRKADERTLARLENVLRSLKQVYEGSSRLGDSWKQVVLKADIASRHFEKTIDIQLKAVSS